MAGDGGGEAAEASPSSLPKWYPSSSWLCLPLSPDPLPREGPGSFTLCQVTRPLSSEGTPRHSVPRMAPAPPSVHGASLSSGWLLSLSPLKTLEGSFPGWTMTNMHGSVSPA